LFVGGSVVDDDVEVVVVVGVVEDDAPSSFSGLNSLISESWCRRGVVGALELTPTTVASVDTASDTERVGTSGVLGLDDAVVVIGNGDAVVDADPGA